MCGVAGGMRWRVRYAADLVSASQIRLDEGVLWLRLEAMRMVLLDADGKTVDARFLKDGERIDIGLQQEGDAGELRSGAELVRTNTMQLMKLCETARQGITGG
ncbi:uncharacterized protein LOC123403371 [Hordeum vulgare subsp. vulgare]|uniref:uncharacterized protein LOC123403371 n=1 Tax=Hordeum vulgare subsp. vulgare TaxID=112509 RepID=UPI00162BDAED|nr:uncharacterized protein LOC123403371 [Hordeum vulgare subsp. vulgare]